LNDDDGDPLSKKERGGQKFLAAPIRLTMAAKTSAATTISAATLTAAATSAAATK
jgi:hypothetical protein